MCFRKHLCNLDASWGSPSLGSLVNLDLNPNTTACDVTSPLCNFSLALISSSTSLLCAPWPKSILRQSSALPPSSTTTHMHQFFCELSLLLKMAGADVAGWGSQPQSFLPSPSSISYIFLVSFSFLPLAPTQVPPLPHIGETFQPNHLMYFAN